MPSTRHCLAPALAACLSPPAAAAYTDRSRWPCRQAHGAGKGVEIARFDPSRHGAGRHAQGPIQCALGWPFLGAEANWLAAAVVWPARLCAEPIKVAVPVQVIGDCAFRLACRAGGFQLAAKGFVRDLTGVAEGHTGTAAMITAKRRNYLAWCGALPDDLRFGNRRRGSSQRRELFRLWKDQPRLLPRHPSNAREQHEP